MLIPTEVFDTILNDEEILKRAVSTLQKTMIHFPKMAEDYFVKGKGDILDVKKQLYPAMINVNILEGLRFYVSFACTFAFGELKLMEGSRKNYSLIARDEATHLNLSTQVIKNWHKGDDAGMTKAMKGLDKTVIEMFKNCVEEEKAWAKHLMKDGPTIGLNEKLLGDYVEWIANKRLKAIGYDPTYDPIANANLFTLDSTLVKPQVGLQVASKKLKLKVILLAD